MDGKKRRKIKKGGTENAETQPNPFELEICNYMYRKLPTKYGRLGGCLVNYFKASDAVDFLLESPWAKPFSGKKDSRNIYFSNREVVIRFMDKLIEKRIIARALKVNRKRRHDDTKTKTPKSNDSKSSSKSANTSDLDGKAALTPELKNGTKTPTESSIMSLSTSSSTKHKKPPRLEYAANQVFSVENKLDECGGEHVYFWLYEAPPGLKTWLMGFALIALVLLFCAHPLWPPSARLGLSYLFMVVFFFVGLIVLLALVRLFLFGTIFIFSIGKLRMWLFPNLFADCGFFESFRPFYSVESVYSSPNSFASPNSNSADSKTD